MQPENYCLYPEYQDRFCLINVFRNPDADVSSVQDDITVCYGCERFKKIASRGIGRREADQAIGDAVIKLMQQLANKNDKLRQTAAELKRTVEQLTLFKSIADAIARSPSLEKSLRIMLTGATSGDAIGFNRAGVLLVNDYTGALEGKCAVGPIDPAEAEAIWPKIAGLPVKQLLDNILAGIVETEFTLESAVKRARIFLSDKQNPLVQILSRSDNEAVLLRVADCGADSAIWWPNAAEFTVVPLKSEQRVLGLVLADNSITGRPFSTESAEALQSLANACAPGIENSILQQELFLKLKELERVHDLLRANQKYLVHHERLADIGMLATKVAHEFKIPLVTIGGYARRLKALASAGKIDSALVEIIIAEIDRLLTINSEILEYSRAPRLDLRECDLCDLLTDAVGRLKDKMADLAIETKIDFHKKKLILNIDPEKMRQVILNLVANAVEAMKNGGRLTIRTRQDNNYIVIEVQDTGQGIAPEEMDNLFRLFYTTKSNGSGLGLPVTKKIIDDHGGFINVRSEKGVGTTFYVHLPVPNSVNKKKENSLS